LGDKIPLIEAGSAGSQKQAMEGAQYQGDLSRWGEI
jgi:hypothetical protein